MFDTFHIYNFHPCNTLIIDDNDKVAKTNPYNCLSIPAFYVVTEEGKFNPNSVNDRSLLNILEKLKYIDHQMQMTNNCLYGYITGNHSKDVPLLKRKDIMHSLN